MANKDAVQALAVALASNRCLQEKAVSELNDDVLKLLLEQERALLELMVKAGSGDG